MVVMEAGFRDLGVREIASRHPAFISFPALGPWGHGEDQTQSQVQDKPRMGDPRGHIVVLAAGRQGPVLPGCLTGVAVG